MHISILNKKSQRSALTTPPRNYNRALMIVHSAHPITASRCHAGGVLPLAFKGSFAFRSTRTNESLRSNSQSFVEALTGIIQTAGYARSHRLTYYAHEIHSNLRFRPVCPLRLRCTSLRVKPRRGRILLYPSHLCPDARSHQVSALRISCVGRSHLSNHGLSSLQLSSALISGVPLT